MQTQSDYLGVKDLCCMFNRHYHTIRKLVRAGKLPPPDVVRPGQLWLWRRDRLPADAVEQFTRSGRVHVGQHDVAAS